jgi:ubiquinol-cytochrome c reductase iron-sulfur subunit
MIVAAFLILTIAGALGATAAAAFRAPPAVFAGAIAVAFAGLAGAAAAAAVALRAPGDLTEPREPRGPSHVAPLPDDGITRPAFGRLWFLALGAFAVLGLVPLISLARRPGRSSVTGWRAGVRLVNDRNEPISSDLLVDGGIDTVFPQDAVANPQSSAVLIRLGPDAVTPQTSATSGYVAFSKICTHAGCPVALYRHASHQLICPCHQSMFDVRAGAKNLSGPATRPLPQLPLAIDRDGFLIATGDFAGPVGPDDWDRVL